MNRKRKFQDTELPLCKYGEKCYQKNWLHKKNFRHPSPQKDEEIETQVNV